MSPCLAVPGSQKKLETPILDNVADTFLAIKPDLPTPAQITLPLQLASTSTALANEELKILLIFFQFLCNFFYSLMFKNIKFKSRLV